MSTPKTPFVRVNGETWQELAVRLAYAHGHRPARVLGAYERVRPDYDRDATAWVQALKDIGVEVELPLGDAESVCDFCSGQPTVKMYPTRSFIAGVIDDGRLLEACDEWAACARCARAVDTNDRTTLANRAVKTLLPIHPLMGTMPDLALRARIFENARKMHDLFFANRISADET